MENKVSKVERIKLASDFLRGTIAEDLYNEEKVKFTLDNVQVLKFHGIYQQKDRDFKKATAKDKSYDPNMMMLRVRIPGGELSTKQWLDMDEISQKYGQKTLKITTRQALQFHYVRKNNLKQVVKSINDSMLDTYAACGDVNRNVMCYPDPLLSDNLLNEIQDFSKELSDYLTPKSLAYKQIWLGENMQDVNTENNFSEPIYGESYLPRKFKIVIAVPPYNDVDIFAHDLGFIAIIENNKIIGYNVTVGGGMGMTHGKEETKPRIADVMGFCEIKDVIKIAEAVITTQRDFGDRTNRTHARLKYTIDDRGIDWFKEEVEKRSSIKLSKPKEYKFITNGDRYGWHENDKGKFHYTMYVQGGRLKENYLNGIREIAKSHNGKFYLTPNQNLIISEVEKSNKDKIQSLLDKHKISNFDKFTSLRLHSLSCVGLPTCGLAMTESERYLPILVDDIDDILKENGLEQTQINVRMTACPNGCARPYLAEIAFVGRSTNKYNIYLGGSRDGSRLNKLYKESVETENLITEVKPMLEKYSSEKNGDESFGDFAWRTKLVS